MNWIFSSALMFISSVVTYLLIRRSNLLNIPTELVNLASFGVPFILYLGLALSDNSSLSISQNGLLIIFVLSITCSYLANITSLKSIKYPPNPGYSLIISKSYVVFTTLAALFLFNSHLTIKSALAILAIVGFSALIVIGKSKPHQHSNPIWFPYAMYSFFGWGILSIGSKYVFTIGVSVIQRLVYLSFMVTIYIVIELLIRKTKIKHISFSNFLLLISIGIFSGSFNYFMFKAIDVAPNIGYVNAINASSISVVTILSALFFKDDLTPKKLIGVFGVIAGLFFLLI